jgi:hypothetical protein
MAAATKKEKKRKEEAYTWKAGASSGHITNLKQSTLDFRYLWYNVIILKLSQNASRIYKIQRIPNLSLYFYSFSVC